MISIINEAINRKLASLSFTNIIVGKVESVSPLQIRINDRIVIGQSFIEPMSLGLNDYSPNSALPLVVGEKIQMVRYNNGQRFYVLGKAVSASAIVDYSKQVVNKPVLKATAEEMLEPIEEPIDGEVVLHKISRTGCYDDLCNKIIIPITFNGDSSKNCYFLEDLLESEVGLLQNMIDRYLEDNDSINNYILHANGSWFYGDDISDEVKFDTVNRQDKIFTFKQSETWENVIVFQFLGSHNIRILNDPYNTFDSIYVMHSGIVIVCDKNYKVNEVVQEVRYGAGGQNYYKLDVLPTSSEKERPAFIPTKDWQPTTKKYVDTNLKQFSDTLTSTLSSKKEKGDFAVISGTSTITSGGTLSIDVDYPEGFNTDNTIPIAFGTKPSDQNFFIYGEPYSLPSYTSSRYIYPAAEKIKIRATSSTSQAGTNLSYILVIMKI